MKMKFMKINSMKNLMIFITMIMVLMSCVGTVEDKNPKTTKGASSDKKAIFFEGVFNAVPVAHDKVEVFFFPAAGDPREYTYLIVYDGLSIPITVPGSTLRPDYRGLLKVTVNQLQINTKYTFNVQAVDTKQNKSANNKIAEAKTFSNITANFAGIAVVRNLAGSDGRNALRVEWPAAEKQGSDFLKKEIDPSQYEITVVEEQFTPAGFDDTSLVDPQRKVVYVSDKKISHQVNGLKAGTKYYIRVRTIHYGYTLNGSDSAYKREVNSNYYLAQTFSDDLASLTEGVDLSNFVVDNGVGAAGLNSFNLSWDPAKSSFEEYRVYYRKTSEGVAWSSYRTGRDDVCDGQESNNPGWYCKKVSYDQNTTTITDLDPYTDYEIVTVICGNNLCSFSDSAEYVSSPPYKTNPGYATFGGLTAIEPARAYWALDEVYLQLTPPDLNSGAIDGILVELIGRTEGPVVDTILNSPAGGNSTGYNVPVFDFTSATEIVVNGIDSNAAENYCFRLLPFVYISGIVTENRDGAVEKCILPQIEAPKIEQFAGLKLDATTADGSTNTITLGWDTPSGGVYDKFILFVRTTPGTFNFGEARNPSDPNYVRFEIPFGENSYTLAFLPEGVYSLGLLAYYEAKTDFSDDNGNVYIFDTSL